LLRRFILIRGIRRLAELSDEQLRDVAVRSQRFKPHIAPAWKAEDIEALIPQE
jgi:hypothetical protein